MLYVRLCLAVAHQCPACGTSNQALEVLEALSLAKALSDVTMKRVPGLASDVSAAQ